MLLHAFPRPLAHLRLHRAIATAAAHDPHPSHAAAGDTVASLLRLRRRLLHLPHALLLALSHLLQGGVEGRLLRRLQRQPGRALAQFLAGGVAAAALQRRLPLRLRGGGFVRSVGPTSFYPLIAGAADEAQVESLLRHLADPETFGGEFRVPSVSRDDPSFRHNVYWRGRVWPPLNWTIWQGLRRYGRFGEATALAQDSERLFRAAWDRRLCPENYNAVTGEPLDQPDTEGFYGWGALMPMMAVGEILDVSPWHGWSVVNEGNELVLGPLRMPAGLGTMRVANGVLELTCGERVLMRTALLGRFTRLRFDAGHVSLVLPAGEGEIGFPSVPAGAVLFASIDGQAAATRADGGGLKVFVPPGGEGRDLVLVWRA